MPATAEVQLCKVERHAMLNIESVQRSLQDQVQSALGACDVETFRKSYLHICIDDKIMTAHLRIQKGDTTIEFSRQVHVLKCRIEAKGYDVSAARDLLADASSLKTVLGRGDDAKRVPVLTLLRRIAIACHKQDRRMQKDSMALEVCRVRHHVEFAVQDVPGQVEQALDELEGLQLFPFPPLLRIAIDEESIKVHLLLHSAKSGTTVDMVTQQHIVKCHIEANGMDAAQLATILVQLKHIRALLPSSPAGSHMDLVELMLQLSRVARAAGPDTSSPYSKQISAGQQPMVIYCRRPNGINTPARAHFSGNGADRWGSPGICSPGRTRQGY